MKPYNLRRWQINSIRCQGELADSPACIRIADRLEMIHNGGELPLPHWGELLTLKRTIAVSLDHKPIVRHFRCSESIK